MKHLTRLFTVVVLATLFFTACEKESSIVAAEEATPSSELTLADILTPPNQAGNVVDFRSGKSPAIWGDCEAFGTVLTNTNFKPSAGKFDELYNGVTFKNGLGAVSESKPGDQDYNGGRWHVNTYKAGLDPNKYLNVCRVEDLDPNDFESTDVYFECPMLPIRSGKPE